MLIFKILRKISIRYQHIQLSAVVYLALFFITYLRNGVLQDIRNSLYHKVINLPVSFFTEKRKGDIMARISSDVLEVQVSFLSVLELLI